jgi:hypothetical protein
MRHLQPAKHTVNFIFNDKVQSACQTVQATYLQWWPLRTLPRSHRTEVHMFDQCPRPKRPHLPLHLCVPAAPA